MWQKLMIAKKASGAARADAGGMCIYAVGDIHGRFDLLAETCLKIDADVRAGAAPRAVEVFVGDYIDRGPDSRLVLSALCQRSKAPNVVCLLGNHEAFLLQFLENPAVLSTWRLHGGLQTLISYGLAPTANPTAREADRLAEQLRENLPVEHLAFLRSLPTSYSIGNFFFAHAGVRPGVPLDQQRDQDLLWIRDEFLLCEDDFGKIVVHGHTPVQAPDVLHNRINIDTGAYATGRLTCLKLNDHGYGFL